MGAKELRVQKEDSYLGVAVALVLTQKCYPTNSHSPQRQAAVSFHCSRAWDVSKCLCWPFWASSRI